MAMVLKQSTASQEILLGPFVDSTDGNTAETSLTIANTDIKLFKHGGTTLANKNSGGATHISDGYYYAVLDATDTDTVGNLEVNVKVSGALAIKREFIVVEEAVYDAFFGASAVGYVSNAPVNVAQISGDATAADTLELFIEALDQSTGQIDSGTFAAGAIDAAAIANGAIDAATFAADVVAEFLSYIVDDATRIDASALNTATGTTIPAIVADTNELQTDWANNGRLDVILDARSSQASVDTIDGIVDDILVDTGTTLPATLSTIAGYLDTEIAAILEDTGTTIPAQISALNNISSANVLTQVNAALDTAISELTVAAPTATPTLRTALMLLYMALRNRTTTTASAQTIQNDAGTTIATATLSDDGTTMTKGEFA